MPQPLQASKGVESNDSSRLREIAAADIAIGRQIRQRREYLGRTQADLASFLGMKRPNVTKIEAGETPLTAANLKKIAGWLGIDDVNFFFDPDSQVDPEETALLAHYRSLPVEARPFILAAIHGVMLALDVKWSQALDAVGKTWKDAVEERAKQVEKAYLDNIGVKHRSDDERFFNRT